MSSTSALALADACLLVLVSGAIVKHPEHIGRVFPPLIAVSKSPKTSFTTSENLLRLLLTCPSPISADIDEISDLAGTLIHAEQNIDLSEPDLIEDMESLSLWITKEFEILAAENEDAIVQTAKDLVVFLATKSHLLSFTMDRNLTDPSRSLFDFVKAKCLQMAQYYEDVISVAESFKSLQNHGPFEAWYHGIIQPYSYFHHNYAALANTGTPEITYLSLETYSDMFGFLVTPLEHREDVLMSKLSPRAYFSNVILPLAVYYDNDLSLISEWLSQNYSSCDTLSEFELWDEILRTTLSFRNYEGESFTKASYDKTLRLYVYACFYFGICTSEHLTPYARTKIQMQIKDTLVYLVEMLGGTNIPSSLDQAPLDFPDFKSLEDFAASPPEFVRKIVEGDLNECLSYGLQVFSTCCSLHTLNQLTVKRFFFLKSQAASETKWFHKEVMQIFSGADSLNYDQIMNTLDVFSESFLSQSIDTLKELDRLVFENFVQTENFENALEYLNALSTERKLHTDVAFLIVNRKFWELYENASNLDDRIGRLKIATRCLGILENFSTQKDLSEANRATVVKIKHLLKAIHSLKNFKLVIVRNQPVTPKQILDTVLSSNTEEKYPQFAIISMVLEQNPKSYLAHERLYKIVNDLAIYADLDVSVVSFPRIQSACVESALIDGNFDFAYKQAKALVTFYVDSKNTKNLCDIWLTFYQVGKYISPDWFGDYDAKIQEERIKVLIEQREILSLAIKYTKPSEFTTDNSRLLVGQFRHVNMEIKKWHEEADLHRSEEVRDAFQSTQKQIQDNLSDLLNEASHSQKQASEKISNLFVSGLGWAIGAKR
ncbi:hypothetical protein METBIDRAFT_45887 [Metschnikowia bicuspidata var. bicuspidata NRRL YB-4993]|uniref:Sec39 domain-containing protein n=1 Tax=Metschnikowia bicuspidata var. bicuspidata NRRL YB-4993 TaxID=869754 RepID=A0A1A0H629_9ASCO|nr:hypothetical protein METBIDRAFT_45887 [Metschnikowia bicuspidata var. bicuspidata NRRL YB-4993]OBA19486.1 hypothetical protein METBIDRAFT_45887 [Metschnikowia bicuspidata var. bicuspidata NRRL YB-4993]